MADAFVKFNAIFCFVIKIVIVMCIAERKLIQIFVVLIPLKKIQIISEFKVRLQVTMWTI